MRPIVVSSSLRYLTPSAPRLAALTASTPIRSGLSLPITRVQHRNPSISPSRFFNTSSIKMSSAFLAAVKSRRTFYQLSHESTIPDSKIIEIVNDTIKNAPSSFNSQSTRVVVLLGDEHTKLWEEIVKPAVKAVAPPEAWAGSEQRLNGFKRRLG